MIIGRKVETKARRNSEFARTSCSLFKEKEKKKKRERRKERDTREREREKEARLQDLLSFKGGNVVGGGVGSEGWTRRNIEDQGRTKSFERSGINLHGLR